MQSLEKILLPVDLYERSRGVARLAKDLARHFRSEITLLHVLAPAHYSPVPMDAAKGLHPHSAEEARRKLETFLVEELRDVTVRRVLLEGDPARTIVDYAHSGHADLIAMATRGCGPFRRFLLGSVTAKVLHDADCPVATDVHLEEALTDEALQNGSVVTAVDLGPHSQKVLEWASGMAREFEARLIVVHAIPSLEAHAGDYFDPNWRTLFANQAREQIERLQQRLGIDAEIFIDSGDAPSVVRCAVQRYRAGLLVIGRGSAAGVFGRLRTNAYAIIRESPCPVVSV